MNFLLLLATDPLFPIRGVAVIALLAVIAAFIYVLGHLQKIERMIVRDDRVHRHR